MVGVRGDLWSPPKQEDFRLLIPGQGDPGRPGMREQAELDDL